MTEPLQILLTDDGDIPNNAILPLLVYRSVVTPKDGDAEDALEALFAANGWGNGWRGQVIFPWHHYHATAHEVVGIGRGTARVQFGGPTGPILDAEAGDVVLIPAGVGHCRIDDDPRQSVVGAYPPGTSADMHRQGDPEGSGVRSTIAAVPLPPTDPVLGRRGGVATLWPGASGR